MREHFNLLSVREKEVLSHVAAGRLNKQIAAELGISEVMVKVHRANGMRKMHAKSVAELVRMTDLLRAGQPELAYAGSLLKRAYISALGS